MWDDSLPVRGQGLRVAVTRAHSTPLDGLPCRSSRVVGFDCSPGTPSQPTTPRQRLPRSPLCSLLQQQEITPKRSLSINIGCTRLSPAFAAVLSARKARSSTDLRAGVPDATSSAAYSPASSLSRPSTPIPIPDSREQTLRPEAALLEDLSMEEHPCHLPTQSADFAMHGTSPGVRSPAADHPLDACSMPKRPDNAVKQLRCVEERLRQSPEQDSAWQMVMHLRVLEEERARLHLESKHMRTRSAALPEDLEIMFDFDEAPPTPPPPRQVSRSTGRQHFGMPPRPPSTCNVSRGFSLPPATATAW